MVQMLIQVTRYLNKSMAEQMTLFPQIARSPVVFAASPFHNFSPFFSLELLPTSVYNLWPVVSSEFPLFPFALSSPHAFWLCWAGTGSWAPHSGGVRATSYIFAGCMKLNSQDIPLTSNTVVAS